MPRGLHEKGPAMLFANIADVFQNDVSAPRLKKALDFIANTDLSQLECGRHDIDGDEVFANVMEFTTVPASEKNYEAHRRYADVHVVISGTEVLGVAPIGECEPVGDFNEADDFGLYTAPGREAWVTLHEGDLVVTPPADAHKPGCCEGEPAPLKKACIKVLVD